MKIDKFKQRVSFHAEDGETLSVYYDNRGEPYRQGVTLSLEDYEDYVGLFLEDQEARELRDLLLKLYPVKSFNG